MSNHLNSHAPALVLGRAGMDLYPTPDGDKINQATGFSVDMGGSAGNIAIAMSRAGSQVALLSALSDDPIGQFVRQQLINAKVDVSLIQQSPTDARTSLALAEVKTSDCEVVIYRNNAADLHLTNNQVITKQVAQSAHLVITGTALIADPSRTSCIELIKTAQENNCKVWFDLDYRPWNWPNKKATQAIYQQAAHYSDVIIGNNEEYAVLTQDLAKWQQQMVTQNKTLIVKYGAQGSSLYNAKGCLRTGVYPVTALKPYGAGDAFLGNLVHAYQTHKNWEPALINASAAAAIVVAKRGCASVMPNTNEIKALQANLTITLAPTWD